MKLYERLHATYEERGFSLDGVTADASELTKIAPSERLPFASEEEVAAFETQVGLRLPSDFREHLLHYYLDAALYDADGYWIEFWPIKWLLTAASPEARRAPYDHHLDEAEKYVLFADTFIHAVVWAIHCGDGSLRGRVIDLRETDVICDSFTEFATIFIESPDRISAFWQGPKAPDSKKIPPS